MAKIDTGRYTTDPTDEELKAASVKKSIKSQPIYPMLRLIIRESK